MTLQGAGSSEPAPFHLPNEAVDTTPAMNEATTLKPRFRKPKVLAISSGGGHWVQLLRLQPALSDCEVVWATVLATSRSEINDPTQRFYQVPDATRWNKFGLIWQALCVLLLVVRVRPQAIITTGAAPGFFAVMFGRLLLRRTCWIDSVANVEELSLSGKQAGRWASLWLTQWPHLANSNGPVCHGNVIGETPK
jgi:UDP-N-acetylglucosamine:LPS N-acetylglucosamine transferase